MWIDGGIDRVNRRIFPWQGDWEYGSIVCFSLKAITGKMTVQRQWSRNSAAQTRDGLQRENKPRRGHRFAPGQAEHLPPF